MPLLPRTRRKLLTVVGGKQHATQDDYADKLPTPPNSNSTRSSGSNARLDDAEEDINRDPDSSDNDDRDLAQVDGPVVLKKPDSRLNRLHLEPAAPVPRFKKSALDSSESLAGKGSKRSDEQSSDAEDSMFSSQPKKQRTGYGRNIHAIDSKRQRTYGRAAKSDQPKRLGGAQFKEAQKVEVEDNAAKPTFQAPKGADLFEFRGADPPREFQLPKSSADVPNSRSSSLASLSSVPSSPGVEEIESLGLPSARAYIAQIDCKICGCSIDRLLKEEFENVQRLTPGKRLNHKWQKRFCRYHKQREAERSWNERGYPQIDWNELERRMLKLHSHLEGVMNGTQPSFYRDELAERLKGAAKTAKQAVQSEDAKGGASVGYYGPRGEKAMTDHIITNTHLAEKLRKAAAKDKLVAASGIAGGVTGFIQAVLVPELAVKLVQEDLGVSGHKAHEVVIESGELGDLLNPEIEEKVDKLVCMDDNV